MGRLRTNVNAPELIKKYPNYCDLDDFKFPKKPIYLEIGCGKGNFLIQQATCNPNIFFLGIEKYSTVILKALKKITRENIKLSNLAFACYDANNLDTKKYKNKISKLFLNFSDPWPKKRHAKRRLTSPSFLNLYKNILKINSIIEFKTDNDMLYQYSIQTLNSRKDIKILYQTNDLYSNLNNKFNKHNIQTEYEKKFVQLNKNINKLIFMFK